LMLLYRRRSRRKDDENVEIKSHIYIFTPTLSL
jgi:hypothetical protein